VCPGVPAAVGGDDGGTGAATDLGAVSAATLRFTLDGSDPAPGERAGQHTAHGAAHVVLGRSAEVRGLCEASGVLPSRVAAGPRALVAEAPHSPTWGGTVGLWNLSAPAAFRGAYARARRAVQGGCIEVHPILVDPFSAPSLAAPRGSPGHSPERFKRECLRFLAEREARAGVIPPPGEGKSTSLARTTRPSVRKPAAALRNGPVRGSKQWGSATSTPPGTQEGHRIGAGSELASTA